MNEKEFNRNCDGTDYGNWVPLNMMKAMGGLTGMLALAEILVTALVKNRMLSILLGGVTGALLLLWLYMLQFRALFDFKRGGLMGRIHQYLADHLDWDGRGKLLDIGCGAGVEHHLQLRPSHGNRRFRAFFHHSGDLGRPGAGIQ